MVKDMFQTDLNKNSRAAIKFVHKNIKLSFQFFLESM